MRAAFFLILLCLFSVNVACAQSEKKTKKKPSPETNSPARDIDQNFCNTLMGIVFHVPDNFSMIKGAELESTPACIRYVSLRGVTGIKTSCIVDENGWRYEGVAYQGNTKNEVTEAYGEYAKMLKDCLLHTDYKFTEKDNEGKNLESYPDLSFRYPTGAVTIELLTRLSDINGIYTILLVVKK